MGTPRYKIPLTKTVIYKVSKHGYIHIYIYVCTCMSVCIHMYVVVKMDPNTHKVKPKDLFSDFPVKYYQKVHLLLNTLLRTVLPIFSLIHINK